MTDERDVNEQNRYRAKLIHADGQIETTLGTAATTEADAMAQVQGLTASYTIELWEESRLLRTLSFADDGDRLAIL